MHKLSDSPFIQRMNALLKTRLAAESEPEKRLADEQMAEAMRTNARSAGWVEDYRQKQTGEVD